VTTKHVEATPEATSEKQREIADFIRSRVAVPLAYTPAEAAELLRIARATLYRYIADGRIQSFTLGRARRISARAIDAFIASREAEAR